MHRLCPALLNESVSLLYVVCHSGTIKHAAIGGVAGREWDVLVDSQPRSDGWYELMLQPVRMHKEPLEAGTVVLLSSQPQSAEQQRRVGTLQKHELKKHQPPPPPPKDPRGTKRPRPLLETAVRASAQAKACGTGEELSAEASIGSTPDGFTSSSAAQARGRDTPPTGTSCQQAPHPSAQAHLVMGIVRVAPVTSSDAAAVHIHPVCSAHAGASVGSAPCSKVLEALKQVRSGAVVAGSAHG